MTIVVDMNCLACVFSTEQADPEFSPVREFILEGVGQLIFGGSKYMEELKRAPRYTKLFNRLRDAGRAIRIRDQAVDVSCEKIERNLRKTDCDDTHIIALLATSNCGLLCSKDRRSFEFIKDTAHYHRDHVGVKIYSGKRNVGLLVRQTQNVWNKD